MGAWPGSALVVFLVQARLEELHMPDWTTVVSSGPVECAAMLLERAPNLQRIHVPEVTSSAAFDSPLHFVVSERPTNSSLISPSS